MATSIRAAGARAADLARGEILATVDRAARLVGFLDEVGVALAGPPGGLFEPELLDEEEQPAELFIPVEQPIAIPTRRARRRARRGAGRDGRGAGARRRLRRDRRYLPHARAWVARHAEPSGERIREWYVVSPADSDDPAAHRTEIAWPITPTPAGC